MAYLAAEVERRPCLERDRPGVGVRRRLTPRLILAYSSDTLILWLTDTLRTTCSTRSPL